MALDDIAIHTVGDYHVAETRFASLSARHEAAWNEFLQALDHDDQRLAAFLREEMRSIESELERLSQALDEV